MVQIKVNYVGDFINKFIDTLDKRTRMSCHQALLELEISGNELTMPLSKYIGDGLFELRIKETANIRILYAFYNNSAWVLHIFKKKSDRIPQKDLDTARRRYRLLLA